MTPTIYVYRGLPGSGKTTHAEAFVDKHQNAVLVGRDHIRRQMGIKGGVGTPAEESQVTATQTRRITDAIDRNGIAVVDDMNLRDRYVTQFEKLAAKLGAEVEIVDLRDVPVETCIKHDLHRHAYGGHYVGEARIRELHRRYILKQSARGQKPGARKGMPASYAPDKHVHHEGFQQAIIVDLDGTTAIKSDKRGYYDYDDRVAYDLPNANVIAVVRALINRGYCPIFLSGRMDSCAEATRKWIQKHIYCGMFDLYMRKTGDHRPDYEVKDEIFDRYVEGHVNVHIAFDDRNQVVDLWRAKGITTLQVQDGNF